MLRLFLLSILMLPISVVQAAEVIVAPTDAALAKALKNAQAGDILRLSPGTYMGPIIIKTPLTLVGNNTTIDGRKLGSVITINASDVTVQGLKVIGSGSGGKGLDAGITLAKTADRSVVRNNHLINNLVGINVHGTKDALVKDNIIKGRRDHRVNDRGNGIYVWNAPGTRVIGNDVQYGRDGIFVNTSKNNTFTGNRFRNLRFAIHYMYANNSTVSENISVKNDIGYAIMFSDNVLIKGNLSMNDRNHGIMMNYTNKSIVKDNTVVQVKDKCVFIYNAHKNTFINNVFKKCRIGIHFTAGSERNEMSQNAFIGNRNQVKYVGSKWVEWSTGGKGNYWSDHAAFDLDGNGIADSAYRPNDIMDHVLWTQPAAKSLLGSPAIQLIRWSQSAFPATLPGGVIDRAPLMRPTYPEIPAWTDKK